MGSIACRDMGGATEEEACDWFIQDDDASKVMIGIIRHNETAHAKSWKGLMGAVLGGQMTFSMPSKHAEEVYRWGPTEEVQNLGLACKDVTALACDVVVPGAGFPALLTNAFAHLEKQHPEYLQEYLKKGLLSPLLEQIRDHAKES